MPAAQGLAPITSITEPAELAGAAEVVGLERTLSAVETRLAALSDALRTRDLAGIDRHATELHVALATAVDTFCIAVRSGPVSPDLRRRLVAASGQVAAQRESLSRATSALDRAIDVLMPRETAAVYAAPGNTRRIRSGSSLRA